MKKSFFVGVFLLLSLVSVFVGASSLVPYKTADGSILKYRDTDDEINVMIPEEYIEKDRDFRGVWITHLVNDFPSYINESQYKKEVQKVFQTLEYFNINAMIFHVRTHNNALYKSELNPVSSYYRNANFDVFDPLAYIIEEAHKRGIEFHAWMNPYRLSSNSGTIEQFAANQPSYNVASNPENILKVGSNQILNPGEPAVREFLVDTVMEVIENYDVDAIHFDDYFYINGVDDTVTRNKYNTEKLSIGDFRRKQIDLFIESLSNEMRAYNLQNNRLVQLGISPSGIYRNGSYVDLDDYEYDENGNLTYPLYSNTSGFAHYDNYLYSDTKKWIDEEWIDYIVPQTYWSFEQPVAGYAPLMDWWNMVVKHKNVNLYSGMGLYMPLESHNTYGWQTNEDEALNQVIYSSNLENVRGHSVYSYKHLRFAYEQTGTGNMMELLIKQFNKVKTDAWKKYTLLPEVRTYDPIVLPKVSNLSVSEVNGKNQISFDKVDGARYYVLYRSKNNIGFNTREIIDVFGSNEDVITYTDKVGGEYNYGVKPMSITNTLGKGETSSKYFKIDFYVDDELVESFKSNESFTLPNIPTKEGYDQVAPKWSVEDFSKIKSNIRVDAVYTINKYSVKFFDKDNNLIKDFEVEHGSTVSAPKAPKVEDHKFKGWDVDFSEVKTDLNIKPIYEKEAAEGILSCININYSVVVFALGFALYMFIRRKK